MAVGHRRGQLVGQHHHPADDRVDLEVRTGEAEGRAAIMGALALYLDFINLFLFLLRIFGQSR